MKDTGTVKFGDFLTNTIICYVFSVYHGNVYLTKTYSVRFLLGRHQEIGESIVMLRILPYQYSLS